MRELDSGEDRKIIGGYEIVSTIAKGGMGVIFKGHDSILNRFIAIKVMAQEFANDADALKRFEREAKAVAKLRHPNIALIHGIGKTDEGIPYMIMEYIDGPSFAQLIDNKVEFPYSRWCEIFIQCSEGLRAAYRQNIIHRDIKPGNIMLNRDDLVKVVDFGLAKMIREDTYKTVQGTVLGTPRYMSPEQALGRTVDHRSDIYSLGATFYHILACRPPYDADTPVALMMKHSSAPLTPIYLVNSKVPIDLCNVVHKMMAKDVNDRYQDYDELLDNLKSVKLAKIAKESGSQDIYSQNTIRMKPGEDLDDIDGFGESLPDYSIPNQRQPSSQGGDDIEQFSSGGGGGLELTQSKIPDYNQGSDSAPGDSQQSDNPNDIKQPLFEEGFGGYVQSAPKSDRKKPLPEINDTRIKESSSRYVYIAITIIIFFLGALTLIFTQFGAQKSEDGKQKGLITRIVLKLFPGPEKKKEKTPEYTQEMAIERTKNNLEITYSAIFEYEAKTGNFPERMDDLIAQKLCNETNLYDGWKGRLVFISTNKTLLSFGPDKEESTTDDFWIDQRGLHSPSTAVMDKLMKMEMEEEM